MRRKNRNAPQRPLSGVGRPCSRVGDDSAAHRPEQAAEIGEDGPRFPDRHVGKVEDGHPLGRLILDLDNVRFDQARPLRIHARGIWFSPYPASISQSVRVGGRYFFSELSKFFG